MSLQPDTATTATEKATPSRLIIEDSPYQFLPNLAAIYGDSCALIVQQLFFKIEIAPYFEGEELPTEEHDGLKWIQIYGFMWWDTLEGICRHLPRSTFYRYRKSLEDSGALKVRDTLGRPERMVYSSKKDEGASWYALDHRIIAEHDQRYRAEFDSAREERREARRWLRKNKGKDAHWRPAPGEDTSKQISFCRELNAELCAERELTEEPPVQLQPARKPRGRSAPKVHSQNENGRVSLDGDGVEVPILEENPVHSQNENGCVSLNSHSQIENASILNLRMETSQIENGADFIPKLRIAPYIDKTELRSKTESLDSTTEDTPMALSPADADVVVKNSHFLSGGASDATTPSATQFGLPEIMATLLPEPTGAAARLAARFRDAAEAHGIDCEDEIAARVVARFPVAVWDESRLKRSIGPDREEIGLNAPVGGAERKSLLGDIEELRWRIFVWPGLRVEVEKYYARKNKPAPFTGAFLTKWREETAPERGWVMQLIDEAKYALRGEKQAMEQTRADAAWDALSAGGRRALDEEVKARARSMPGSVDASEARVRRQLLLSSEFLASLETLPDPASQAHQMSQALQSAAPSALAAALTPTEEGRCDLYTVQLRRRIESGEVEWADLGREFTRLGVTPAMKTRIEAELEGATPLERVA